MTTRSPFNRSFLLWVLAATLLGAGLRLYQLDEGSFWLDELYTIQSSSRLSELQRSKALGYVPTVIGFHLAGIDPSSIPLAPYAWRSMGIDEMVTRLPTALLGIISVPLIGLASWRLLGPRAAIIATFLLAVAPWHIYWSQAARFYIPQFLFYTLSLILYFTATRSRGAGRSPARFVAAMACMVLAFLSQPTALIILGIFAADWIIAQLRGRPLRLGPVEWAAGIAAAGFCVSVLIYDIWLAPQNWLHFVEGAAFHQSPMRLLLGAAYMIGPALATFASLSACGLWPGRPRLAVYLTLGALLPVVVFAAMSGWAFVGLRYAFICLFPWLALAAIGADRLYALLLDRAGVAMAWSPLAALLASLAVSNYIYFSSKGNFHARWREAADYVREHRRPGEPVMTSDLRTAQYYLEDPEVQRLPRSPEQVRDLDETTWFIVELNYVANSGRFWLLPDAELMEQYPLRIMHGTSIVQVYRYEP